jgi:hypothetical protein
MSSASHSSSPRRTYTVGVDRAVDPDGPVAVPRGGAGGVSGRSPYSVTGTIRTQGNIE